MQRLALHSSPITHHPSPTLHSPIHIITTLPHSHNHYPYCTTRRTINIEGVREQCVLVSDAISSTIGTLLGPGSKFKSLTDADGSGVITRSVLKVLEHLDVEEHPVGKAYKQCCEGYVIFAGESGLCTLVTLIGLLVKKGNELENKGIPLINVMEGFRTAANVCKDVFESIAISFPTIITNQQNHVNIQDSLFENNVEITTLTSGNGNDENSDGINTILGNMNFLQFSDNEEVPKKKNNESTQLKQMLSKLGISAFPSSVPEIQNADDVAWFFEDEVEKDEISSTQLLSNNIPNEISTPQSHDRPPTNTSTFNSSTTRVNTTSNVDCLDIIATRLSHGNDVMMVKAVEAARLLGEGEWDMHRLILRQVGFENLSVIEGLLVPLHQDTPFLSCTCTANTSRITDSDAAQSIGLETRKREWRGRVCVVEGDVLIASDVVVEGVTSEVSVDEWYTMHSQADDKSTSYNESVRELLLQHDVKLVVLSGDAPVALCETLHASGIHVLPNIYT